MKGFLLITIIFLTVHAVAQQKATPEVFAESISSKDLQKHVFIIAGKEMEGRETGTEGQKKATAYIEAQFTEIGLQPGNKGSYQQLFTVIDGVPERIRNRDTLSKKPRERQMLLTSNIIGIIPGTDLKDEYLLITAHYDHLGKKNTVIYFGADDNGSGTTAVIELAKAFMKAKEAGQGPRRTIIFMTLTGEEEGLWGSQFYTRYPIFPLKKTTADLNIDMIGRTDENRSSADSAKYIYIIGDERLSSELRPISEQQNRSYVNLQLDYKFNAPDAPARLFYRSDHYNFALRGIPVVFYTDGMTDGDYHTPADTPLKIDYPLMELRVKLIFFTAWELANRDTMLKRNRSIWYTSK